MIFFGDQKQGQTDLTKLSSESAQAASEALAEAKEFKSPYIDPEHLVLALLELTSVFELIEGAGADVKKVQDDVKATLTTGEFSGTPEFSSKTQTMLADAIQIATADKKDFVEPIHLIKAALKHADWPAAKALSQNAVDEGKLDQSYQKVSQSTEGKIQSAETSEDIQKEKDKRAGKSYVDAYTIDMTAKAQRGELDPVIERDKEIERVMEILTRRSKNNPILVGEAGVGKTAVVEGLAQKIASGQVPANLKDKRILILDLSLLIAGAKHRGEFEERLEQLMKEVQQAAGTIILFIDEIHTVVGAGGGEGSLDASNILKPALARGEVQVIGATTVKEFRQYIEKDAAFERRFQRVMVEEPTEEQAVKMLDGIKKKYEDHHKVTILPEAIEAAVKLSKRYISDRFLPDKAIDVIDEACAKLVLKNTEQKEVNEALVREVISNWTGVPIAKMGQDESETLLNLENLIHQRLIDQEQAVKVVAEAIRRNRAGLKNPKRPIGSFVFMGPTGVGKTELAKTLAEVMFGAEDKMIRIDMSEYMEKNATARMIGAPPGYVGYEEGGQLTEAVRKNPYSVVLFDEIEKAHRDVFNVFLQILDDGRLTDSKGRTVDFKNTIIICTSNIGTELIKQGNVDDPNLHKQLVTELMKFFRPEFVNRFDEITVFRSLRKQDMNAIVDIMVKEIVKLLAEQKVSISISQRAKDGLSQLGYDPVFGARPLRRVIQRNIENQISTAILKQELKPGQNIVVDYDGQNFTFKVSDTPPAQAAAFTGPNSAQPQSPIIANQTQGQPTDPSGLAAPAETDPSGLGSPAETELEPGSPAKYMASNQQ